jgi:hypothetical protein
MAAAIQGVTHLIFVSLNETTFVRKVDGTRNAISYRNSKLSRHTVQCIYLLCAVLKRCISFDGASRLGVPASAATDAQQKQKSRRGLGRGGFFIETAGLRPPRHPFRRVP